MDTQPTTTPSAEAAFGRRHRRPVAKARLSTAEIKRLARRGGVIRVGGGVHDEMRLALRSFLTGVIKDSVVFCEHSRRKTVFTGDVVLALKRAGNSSWHTVLYGYDEPAPLRRRRRRPTTNHVVDAPPIEAPRKIKLEEATGDAVAAEESQCM